MAKRSSFVLFVFVMSVMLLFTACGTKESTTKNDAMKLQVYTSMYPLYDFAQKIGGDIVEVHNMMPPGVEGHDYEPKPKDIVALHDADLFIYNGAGYEAWADKVIETLDQNKIYVLNATESISLLKDNTLGHDHGGDDKTHEHGAEPNYDPHVWLNPQLAKLQAEVIKDALVALDEHNANSYEANYAQLAAQFDRLDERLKGVVQQAERKEIVVSHAAFGYLAEAYGIEQIAISGITPSAEPSQKDVQAIIEFVEDNDVKYIFFEPIVRSKVAEVVKNETGAEALTLHPLENLTKDELARGDDYFSVMEENIQHLETALLVRR